jgi:hypothetical protein
MSRGIDLSTLRSAVIGSAGTIRLAGEGVMPRHAEIAVQESPEVVASMLRPLDGPVSVERRGRRHPVGTAWRLADGDVIIVGPHRLTYRDLGSPMETSLDDVHIQEVVSWLL